MRHLLQVVESMFTPLLRHLATLLVLLSAAFPSIALAETRTVLVFGDSLVAGYGLPAEQGFVAQLQAALDAQGADIKLINAGVSGDTTGGGLARLDWALADKPDAVLLELGANDMLRGLPVDRVRENLTAILERLRAENIPVLLAGMRANRGLGPDYVAEYDRLFQELASQYDAALYPFFLEGVVMVESLNQADLMHPNAKGVAEIVRRITPHVIDLVR